MRLKVQMESLPQKLYQAETELFICPSEKPGTEKPAVQFPQKTIFFFWGGGDCFFDTGFLSIALDVLELVL